MATWYVDSTATGTAAGTSWTNACTSFAQLLALGTPPAAGDDIDVYNLHNESSAGALPLTFPGTPASPNRIFSCDRTNSPAQAGDLLAGAKIATTGSGTTTIKGTIYCYGVTFSAGSGTGVSSIVLGKTSYEFFDSCTFTLGGTATTSVIQLGATASNDAETVLYNPVMNFNNVSQSINGQGRIKWYGNGASSFGSLFPTNLISSTTSFTLLIQGVDLSQLGSGKTIVASGADASEVQILNCKLGASVTVAATPTNPYNNKTDLINSDSGATGYRSERYWYQGTLTTSNSVYNNATDGVTPISWKVQTSANAKRFMPFECFEIVQWIAPGTYSSTLININSQVSGITNADIWVEAQVLDNASFPISDLYTSAPATQLTAGTNLTSGSTWPAPSNFSFVLNVPSFTVAIAGYVRFVVKIAKPSAFFYIDPKIVVA